MSETNNPQFSPDEIASAFAHIESKWPELTREQKHDNGTLIGLPYPYIVPSSEPQSGFVFDEMYYWDSYFIAQGLLSSGHRELADGMLENLCVLFKKLHIIPTANRYYHTSRSQPPLLTSYIFDIYEKTGKDHTWLNDHLWIAKREYDEVWISDSHPTHHQVYKGLSRYYDVNVIDDLAECESGWDMTTRFSRKGLAHIPIDLNCMLYKYELDFAKGFDILGDEDTVSLWRERASKRLKSINDELWDEDKGFFFDLNYVSGEHSPVWSLASYFAMWSGLATSTQAARMVENLSKFLRVGGLTTTSDPNEFPESDMPHQWAYPNGWAPLHWIVVAGLERYGYHAEAQMVTRRWISTNINYFEAFGVFREAYDVVDGINTPHSGLYPPQIGFGWTNAVFVDLAKRYLTDKELTKV